MHGSLRFFLAVVVALSHIGYSGQINSGIASVAVFYMLAGYVVTKLIYKHFPLERTGAFYLERALRIYPLYWTFLLLTAGFLYFTGFGPVTVTPLKVFVNTIIIPLNWQMKIDVGIVRGFPVLPPSWSLGAELQAYLVLPFIIRFLPVKWVLGLGSLGLFVLASSGVVKPAYAWGYFLLPGTLFIYLTGSALAKEIKRPREADSFDRSFPLVCWMSLLVLLILLSITGRFHPITTAVCLGYLVGQPLVRFTSVKPWRVPGDAVLGRLSYGLFLIHEPVSWVFEYRMGHRDFGFLHVVGILTVAAVLAALASYTVENLVWKIRAALTRKDGGAAATGG